MKGKDDDNYEQHRNHPMIVILICGILLIIVGAYLLIKDFVPHGTTLPSKMVGGGHDIYINGYTTIALGVAISIFPVYQLVKNKQRKNKGSG